MVRATARTSLPSSGAGLAFCHSLEGKADETFIREFFKGQNTLQAAQGAVRLGIDELIAA